MVEGASNMVVAEIAAGIGALKTAWDMVEKIRGSLKQTDPEKAEAVEAELSEAMTAFKNAEAQLALTLGYKVCKKHWPPEIMKLDRVDEYLNMEVFRCTVCDHQEPTEDYLRKRTDAGRKVDAHNAKIDKILSGGD